MHTQHAGDDQEIVPNRRAADLFVDTLVAEVLGSGLAEVERSLVLGDPASLYGAVSIWYNSLPASDQQQVMSIAQIAMSDALHTILALFDGLKVLVGEGFGAPGDNILHYGVHLEIYPGTDVSEGDQQTLSQIAINPWGETTDYLCQRLAERLERMGQEKAS